MRAGAGGHRYEDYLNIFAGYESMCPNGLSVRTGLPCDVELQRCIALESTESFTPEEALELLRRTEAGKRLHGDSGLEKTYGVE